MNRRELLKAIPATAIATSKLNGKQIVAFFRLPADHKIIAFFNTNAIPLEVFSKIELPVKVTLCPVSIPEGQTIDDVIRIYDLGGPH